MGCRHEDIRKCKRDLERILQIEDILHDEKYANDSLSFELTDLSISCNVTFSCENMSDLMSEERKVNKDLIDEFPKLSMACEEKRAELNISLSEMEREDHHYHEERRKHHHDDDDD